MNQRVRGGAQPRRGDLVGLVGRRVAGERAGVVAALLAALYPSIWAPDGALHRMSVTYADELRPLELIVA